MKLSARVKLSERVKLSKGACKGQSHTCCPLNLACFMQRAWDQQTAYRQVHVCRLLFLHPAAAGAMRLLLLPHVRLRTLAAQQQPAWCCQHIDVSVVRIHRQLLPRQLLIKCQRNCNAQTTHRAAPHRAGMTSHQHSPVIACARWLVTQTPPRPQAHTAKGACTLSCTPQQ